THRVGHLTEWRSVEVVGEGLRTSYLRPARGVGETLRPVDDESMRQYPKLSALGLGDSVHAEEAAQENGGAAPFGKKIVVQQQSGDDDRRDQRDSQQQRGHGEGRAEIDIPKHDDQE